MQKHTIADDVFEAASAGAVTTAAAPPVMAPLTQAVATTPAGKPVGDASKQQSQALIPMLCTLLPAFRGAYKQKRVEQRAVALLFAKLATDGRQTLTQLLLTLGQRDADWSAAYRLFSRGRVDEARLCQALLHLTLAHAPDDQPYVVGVDGTHIPRSSKKMPGCGWMRAPNTAPFMRGIQPGQRFVQCAFLTPIANGYSRAIPLRFLPAPPASAVKAKTAAASCSEWQAALTELAWLRMELDQGGRSAQPVLVLGDGNYDTVEMWKGLPERTLLVARTAKNRVLKELPVNLPGQRGRRRKYGARAKTPQAYLHDRPRWQKCVLRVRGRDLRLNYQVAGPFLREGAPDTPLFLLVVQGASWTVGKRKPRKKVRDPAFFLVSAVQEDGKWQLPLSVQTLLAWTWQRWELEVAHREMKSGMGVGEMQCWSKRSAILSVQWCVWAYALLILTAYRCWGMDGGPPAPGKWRRQRHRRWSINTVWRSYRQELWAQREFPASYRPFPTTWPKIEQWVDTLLNGALTNGVT